MIKKSLGLYTWHGGYSLTTFEINSETYYEIETVIKRPLSFDSLTTDLKELSVKEIWDFYTNNSPTILKIINNYLNPEVIEDLDLLLEDGRVLLNGLVNDGKVKLSEGSKESIHNFDLSNPSPKVFSLLLGLQSYDVTNFIWQE